MNTPPTSTRAERPVRCWCGNAWLEEFSPDYWRCAECETLVLQTMPGDEISQVRDDERDFYGKGYYLHHVQTDYGLPDLATRARADLPERCLHWLKTLLRYIPGPGAHTLELGCGHGGFVAMQRWAGLDAVGLELSPWLVRQARDWFGVPVLEGRLEDQHLPAHDWDAVVLMDVLEHLPDPRRTLRDAVALLRSPGSFLLIQTPCYPAGQSYEALRAQDHPFLQMLKPMEHLYLFSERAVARLCAELGVGEVRFEPAIFAHYDLFAAASAGPLRARAADERTCNLLSAAPPARWTLALLDLSDARDVDAARAQAANAELWTEIDAARNARNLADAQRADVEGQFKHLEADNAARLEVIEQQGQEIGRLREAGPGRDLLTAQIQALNDHLRLGEEDRAARLQVIEAQGAELGELRARLSNASAEATAMRGHYERSEADRAARLEVIQNQGVALGEVQAQLQARAADLHHAEHERGRLAAELDRSHETHGALQARFAVNDRAREQLVAELGELRTRHTAQTVELEASLQRQEAMEQHWTARLLRRIGLWPH